MQESHVFWKLIIARRQHSFEHSLDNYFMDKKDKNWLFFKKSEQYQSWKLLRPGLFVLNRFRHEQVSRLPELVDD